MSHVDADLSTRAAGPAFATTHWTLVLAAGRDHDGASAALETLCRIYWYPVYAYLRRRVGNVHDAQDVAQAFFEHLLQKGALARADPQRGRFRSFLLTACKHFLLNEWDKQRAAKRGGGRAVLSLDYETGESKYGLTAVSAETPERLFEQQWALTLLERVLEQLRQEFAAKGKLPHYEHLKPLLTGTNAAELDKAASALGMTPGAVKVAAHRLRGRYRELIRAEIAQTVADPSEVEDEIRNLFAALASENRQNCL